MNTQKIMHRVSLISTGVLLSRGSTAAGYEIAPIDPSRAYDAMVVRLAPILRTHFDLEYPFTEELRPHFDPTDPVGLIRSPWVQEASAEKAKAQEEPILVRLLSYAEFVRNGKGRVLAYVIETLSPGKRSPVVRIAPVRQPYNGNAKRGFDNEIGSFVDRNSEKLSQRPELTTIFEAFVDAREEFRLDISVARYWAVLETLSTRWIQMGGERPDDLPSIVWKGSPVSANSKLDRVWAYCHLPHYVPVHLEGPEHPLSDQLRASYMLRNLTMHGPEVTRNGEEELALVEKFKAQPFPHHWFGLRHLCEGALRWELSL